MSHIRIPLQDTITHMEILYESIITSQVSKREIVPIELNKTNLGNHVVRAYCLERNEMRNFVDGCIIDAYSINHKPSNLKALHHILREKKSLILTYQDFLYKRAEIQSFHTPSWIDAILHESARNGVEISHAMLVWDEKSSHLYTNLEEPEYQSGHEVMAHRAMLHSIKNKILEHIEKPCGALAFCREQVIIEGKRYLMALHDQDEWTSL